MDVLAIDVGGTHVKALASGATEPRRFQSGPALTPGALVEGIRAIAADWYYEAVALGVPASVGRRGIQAEPGTLGPGWVGFDFAAAFGMPVRLANDAVMQALGAYQGGRMLFLGLGTGVGSALITEHVVVPLELGDLSYDRARSLADVLGARGRRSLTSTAWHAVVHETIAMLRPAFVADYVVVGGGNAKHIDPLPPETRRGSNIDAFTGGFRLWEETVEPHDRQPAAVWRVLS